MRRLAGRTGRVTGALSILGPEYGDWDEAVAQLAFGRGLGLLVAVHAGGPACGGCTTPACSAPTCSWSTSTRSPPTTRSCSPRPARPWW